MAPILRVCTAHESAVHDIFQQIVIVGIKSVNNTYIVRGKVK